MLLPGLFVPTKQTEESEITLFGSFPEVWVIPIGSVHCSWGCGASTVGSGRAYVRCGAKVAKWSSAELQMERSSFGFAAWLNKLNRMSGCWLSTLGSCLLAFTSIAISIPNLQLPLLPPSPMSSCDIVFLLSFFLRLFSFCTI